MPKVITINPNIGIKKGGAYMVQNIRPDANGNGFLCATLYNILKKESGTKTALLSLQKNSVGQTIYNSDGNTNIGIWTRGDSGYINYLSPSYNYIYTCNTLGSNGIGPTGLEIDFDNELVYSLKNYIGKTATTEISNSIGSTDTTITIDDTSGFASSGTAIILDTISNTEKEVISYTGISAGTLTGVTRGYNNTTASSHSAKSIIIGFNDSFINLSATYSRNTDYLPIKQFGKDMVIGIRNEVYGWENSDGSDFASKVTLPANYTIVAFGEPTVSQLPMLPIIANNGRTGMIFWWDGTSTTYNFYTPIPEEIYSITNKGNVYFVLTQVGIYYVSAYNARLLTKYPDNTGLFNRTVVIGRKSLVVGNDLFFYSYGSGYGEGKQGLWKYDIQTNSFWFYVNGNGDSTSVTIGSIFYDTTYGSTLYVFNDYNDGAVDYLTDYHSNIYSSFYQFIVEPNPDYKTLQEIVLDVSCDDRDTLQKTRDYNFDVIVRYHDYKKSFLNYEMTSTTGASASNKLNITKTDPVPFVGGRIEVLRRTTSSWSDIAGQVRDIESVTEKASYYEVTLDENLNGTQDNSAYELEILPLTKVKKVSVSGDIDLDDLRIKCNFPTWKKLLVEVEIRGNSGQYISPQVNKISLIYGNR